MTLQPLQLPQGQKPKPGQTDEEFWPDELKDDSDWAKAVRKLQETSKS